MKRFLILKRNEHELVKLKKERRNEKILGFCFFSFSESVEGYVKGLVSVSVAKK
jgi:hypothetical protein